MKTKQCRSLLRRAVLAGVGFLFIPAASVHAQFTANYQTNVIDGVVSNWAGDYLVGSNTFADVLLIQNNGKLTNWTGYLGYEVSSSNNSVLVTGTGSVWNYNANLNIGYSGAGNNLVISNGGRVVNTYTGGLGYIGYNSGSSNNSVLVTGSGSV
jgi:T5SS/PEP-CTERM-associated repeat protein